MNAHEIIRALGGATKIAASASIPRSRIANWQTSGIPGQYWPILERLARKDGIDAVTMDVLEKHRQLSVTTSSTPVSATTPAAA